MYHYAPQIYLPKIDALLRIVISYVLWPYISPVCTVPSFCNYAGVIFMEAEKFSLMTLWEKCM